MNWNTAASRSYEGRIMPRIGKGYTTKQDGSGKVTIEKVPVYRDKSHEIRAQKSKKVKPMRPQLNFSPANKG